MTKMPIRTAGAPSPSGAYSQGIAVGPWVFTAGVGPNDPVSGELVGSTIETQTQQVLSNLEAIVAARGLDRDNIVKVTAHLEDLDRDFPGFDAACRAFFREPYPVRTTVGSRLDGILVEIDCIAVSSTPADEEESGTLITRTDQP